MSLKKTIRDIIFRHDTPSSKTFDITLLILIVLSVVLVMLESVESISKQYETQLYIAEWVITIVFTIEYFLRIITMVPKHWHYIKSFYGLVDLISILPSFIEIFIPSTHYLGVIRALRLLRVFRIFKLTKYLGESQVLMRALYASRHKISVFLLTVLTCTIIIGSIMYVVEGEEGGFNNIPKSIYWAIVTLTTVGYGDIAPITPLGQFLAAFVMILGYGIIAVPTGIVSVEIAEASKEDISQVCEECGCEGHNINASFCYKCGTTLKDDKLNSY